LSGGGIVAGICALGCIAADVLVSNVTIIDNNATRRWRGDPRLWR
jgi:hypothetical protein